MRAIRIHEHGGSECLRLENAPDPACGNRDAIIRVEACALNRLDLAVRRGIPGVTIQLPRILGSDIGGEIVELGKEVTGDYPFRVGQKILLSPGVGCGHCHYCLAGRDNECRQYTVFGYGRDGGYAELVAAPATHLLPAPGNLDLLQAASTPLIFLTAWNMLVVQAGVQQGQKVLVWAAASGVGIAAIQIARLFHCNVIATAGAKEKIELAKRLGADHVIDPYDTKTPVSRAVKAIWPEGVDIVVEHVGQASWDQSVRSLASGGTVVTCGATTGYEATLDLRHLFARRLRLMGSYMGRRADMDGLIQLLARGELQPVVDRVFPLAEAAAAHDYLEQKKQVGKVVLKID